MNTKISQSLALPNFIVNLDLPLHKDHFIEEENGKELEIFSISQYIQRMPNLSINDKSTIMAAIKIGAIPSIYVEGDKNGNNFVIWCQKSQAYKKVEWRGPNSNGKKKSEDLNFVPKLFPYKRFPSLNFKVIKTAKFEIIAEEGQRWIEHRKKYILLDIDNNRINSVKKVSVIDKL
jgi:hypothetical protein